MTTDEALRLAQQLHPLDLAARMAYIRYMQDSCNGDDLAAWMEAGDITRNGEPNEQTRP